VIGLALAGLFVLTTLIEGLSGLGLFRDGWS
jgi:hypothetical protein